MSLDRGARAAFISSAFRNRFLAIATLPLKAAVERWLLGVGSGMVLRCWRIICGSSHLLRRVSLVAVRSALGTVRTLCVTKAGEWSYIARAFDAKISVRRRPRGHDTHSGVGQLMAETGGLGKSRRVSENGWQKCLCRTQVAQRAYSLNTFAFLAETEVVVL
jgi:hypothetical protein